ACLLKLSDPAFRLNVDADIRAYIEQRGAPSLAPDHREALVIAAKGNFLYVHWLLDEVAQGVRKADDLTTLPVGLHALYHDSLKRLADLNAWPKPSQPLLGRLSVAASEVPMELLGEWTNQQGKVANNLSRIYQFVETSIDGLSYRLYHRSMADFFALPIYDSNGEKKPNPYHTPPRLQHQAISDFYLKRFHGRWQDCDAYGMRHLPWHLQKAGESSRLRQLVLSPDWLQAKLERAIQADSIEDRQLLGRLDLIPGTGLGDGADLSALATLLQRQSLLLSKDLPVERHLPHFWMQQIHNAALELGLRDLSKEAERRLRQSQVTWVRALWKAENESPELERTFLLNRSRIFSVALSPDGKLVAAGNEEGDAKVWDVETGWMLQPFDAEERPFFHGVRLAGSAAGGYQLRRFTESALTVWDLGTHATRSEFTAPDDAILVSATADGQWRVLRTGMTDFVLVDVQGARSWSMNVGDGIPRRRMRAAIDGSRGQAVVSDGWQVWLLKGADASTGVVKELAHFLQPVLALAISDDGRFAAGRSGDHTVIWDLQACDEIWRFPCAAGRGLAFFGNREVVVSDEITLKVWDFITGRLTRVLASHLARIDAVTGTPGSPRLASADAGGTVKVWNLTAASHQATRSMHGEAVLAIAVTSDAKRLVSVHQDGTRCAWDAKTGECVCAWPGARLSMAAFTPDARYAIVSQRMHHFDVWDLETGDKTCELRVGGRQAATSWAVSSDGRRFAVGTHEGYCKAWDVRTGREIVPDVLGVFSRADPSREEEIEMMRGTARDLTIRTRAEVRAVAFTHGDRRLIAVHSDGSAEQWDLKTGTANVLRTDVPCDQIIPLPTGDHAVVFQGVRLYVWGLEDGTKELLGENPSPTVAVAAQVDRQGRYVVCCLADRRMAVWDLRAREVLAHVPFDNTPYCIAVGSDNAVFVGDVVGNIYGLAIEGLG
ncbi:MAG: hypothetical protein JO051_07230, partial [Acidobacteriaceae bacterium]|nr:hypothetical protein [Acidobacteriaceae bacterium]